MSYFQCEGYLELKLAKQNEDQQHEEKMMTFLINMFYNFSKQRLQTMCKPIKKGMRIRKYWSYDISQIPNPNWL